MGSLIRMGVTLRLRIVFGQNLKILELLLGWNSAQFGKLLIKRLT